MLEINATLLALTIAMTMMWVMLTARDLIEFAQDRERKVVRHALSLVPICALLWAMWVILVHYHA